MAYQGKSYFLLDTEYIAIIHVEKFYRLRRLLNESEGGTILLSPPGRAQVFPYLNPGPLDLLVVCKNE
jgi:hypothetical protein